MNQTEPMEGLLAQLGKAHSDGAFARTGSAAYPWQAERRSVASRSASKSLSWVRVAIPLAAAAAVAVLFVLPNRAVQEMARNRLAVVAPEQPKTFADAEPAATQGLSNQGRSLNGDAPDCDYNGDGQIDGRDIQALVDQLRDTDADAQIKADYLQRCLLGS